MNARVLYAWELGDNAGHVTRGAALGTNLRDGQTSFLSAVRNTTVAQQVLRPRGFHFVQSPVHMRPVTRPFRHAISSYAGILAASGYDNSDDLLGMLEAWVSLIRLYHADVVLLDHAPTALLACRVLGVAAIAIGSGFEIAPSQYPLPSFWGAAPSAEATANETMVLNNINQCLTRLGSVAITSIGQLFSEIPCVFTTYPELDHYGARTTGIYVGPLEHVHKQSKAVWRGPHRHNVFVYLVADEILQEKVISVLLSLNVNAICVFPNLLPMIKLNSKRIQLFSDMLDLKDIFRDTDVIITNGGAGLVAESLSRGIAMILLPDSPEQLLGAQRVQALGAAKLLQSNPSIDDLYVAISSFTVAGSEQAAAKSFQSKYIHLTPAVAFDQISKIISLLADRNPALDGG